MTKPAVDVAIAGGGLAGLGLALDLARTGRRVALLERRRTLGGSADVGVHLVMSACTRCLGRLEGLGVRSALLDLGRRAEVVAGDRRLWLPLGLPAAAGTLLLLAQAPWRAAGLAASLRRLAHATAPSGATALDLLADGGRAAGFAGRFWREWALSVFNAPMEQVDAGLFLATQRALFADPCRQRPFLVENDGGVWSRAFHAHLEGAGVRILAGTALRAVERSTHAVTAFLGDGVRLEAREYVWAGPPDGLAAVSGLAELQPPLPPRRLGRHIVNLHVPVAGGGGLRGQAVMRGWFGQSLQWLFPGGEGEVVLVGSAWDDEGLARRQEVAKRLPALLRAFGLAPAGSARWRVHRHATALPSPDFEARRPGPATALTNLRFCGSWLDTGLPLTMESALAAADLTRASMSFD